METCEICDAKTPEHHACDECFEGGMCEGCAGEPRLHFCKFAVKVKRRRLINVIRHRRSKAVAKSRQTVADFLHGLDGSGRAERKVPE